MKLTGRKRWLLLFLALLLTTQTACLSRGDTRAAIQSQLKATDSVWAKALPAEFRSDLAKFADAPIHRYHLTYDPETRKLSGTAEILFTNTTDHALPTLYMRTTAKAWGTTAGGDFTMSDLKVNNKQADFTFGTTLVTVPLAQPLEPGKSLRLTYAATVTLPKLGLNQAGKATANGNYGLFGAGPDVTGVGGFPALLPNGEEGKQFDVLPENEYTDAGYLNLDEVWLTLPSDWMILPFGTLVDETPAKNGQKTAHVVNPSRGGGLGGMMLITRTLTRRVAKVGDIEVRTYIDSFHDEFADAIMKDVQDALQTFQPAYGPALLQKLDVVVMPLTGAGGAYCGGGVLSISPTYVTGDRRAAPDTVSPPLKILLETDMPFFMRRLIFHEVSHAWWGELVGGDNTTGTWFPEAMANASSVYAFDRLDGVAAGDNWRTRMAWAYQKQRMLGMNDAPLNLPLAQYADYAQRNTLTYQKGSLFFDRLRKQVGDDKFFAAMRSFLSKHAFGAVPEPGPVAELLQEPGVEHLYTRWVKEAHGDEDIGTIEIHDNAIRKLLGVPAEPGK